MSRVVHVNLGDRGYDIRIGRDLPIGVSLSGRKGVKALIVSDSNVDALLGASCASRLRAEGIPSSRIVIPAGETSKDFVQLQAILEGAVLAGLDRRSVIVALGGGVVGDLAGFAAATLFRGVALIQVPTSLLAMVDSSVGGKTAINLPQGKNLVGAFHQPVEVAADLAALDTLPDREYVSGLAEVVKYGVIQDAVFFEDLERNVAPLLARDGERIEQVVARCCELKAEVVAADERESGVRALLNFGHTFAHTLEQSSGYGVWLHGEAVAVGMLYAAEVSVLAGRLLPSERDRLRRLLGALGLPVSARREGRAAPPWPELRLGMLTDKKTQAGIPRFVLAKRLGSAVAGCVVEEETLTRAFQALERAAASMR